MKFYQKLYWDIRNIFEYAYLKFLRPFNRGTLSHRKDKRDIDFILGTTAQAEAHTLVVDYWFDQEYFNICVFASRVMGMSNQEGIRFSVRWFVKVARKLGMIKGNGYSYLRAGNHIVKHIGAIPYELMPDEINGMTWEEYSKWTPEDEKLLEVAKNFKSSHYGRVTTKEKAIKVVRAGYRLFTASPWYSEDFNPQAPDFKLTHTGAKVGAHAYYSDTERNDGDDFRTPGTFNRNTFGDHGFAWIDDLFASEQFDVYAQEKLPPESHDYYKQFILKT